MGSRSCLGPTPPTFTKRLEAKSSWFVYKMIVNAENQRHYFKKKTIGIKELHKVARFKTTVIYMCVCMYIYDGFSLTQQ